ncbi:MAG: Digeranylgeranylglycerophospholipid reductase [Methanoregulaceae archaeon PtaB.Bin108]|nr:MAG: Digeranylgeranylglycerophospholipid reductase [Methanoregulaceae archaeon PtaB.Bin108]
MFGKETRSAQVHLVSGTIPLGTRSRTFGNHVLFIGDAAGMAKPTSGGGVYTGVRAARHAARVIGEALSENDSGDTSLSEYQKAWKNDFGRELDLGMQLFRIRQGISPADMSRVITVLGDPAILEDIVMLGDMDRPGKLIRRLLMRPSLFHLLGILIKTEVCRIYKE